MIAGLPIITIPPCRMPHADQGEVAERLRRLLAQDLSTLTWINIACCLSALGDVPTSRNFQCVSWRL